MTVIKHYDEPVPFHKALPGAKSIVIMKRDEPAVASTAPKNSTRVGNNTMTVYGNDISRGPYHLMLDRQARARQAITGESYAKAFTETYVDPKNRAICDMARLDHLSKQHDQIHGTRLSLIPKVEKAAPYDPIAKHAEIAEHLGPAHARLHSLAVDHQRATSGLTYERAYSHVYSRPENEGLRAAVKAEHMQSTMAGYRHGGQE